MKSPESRPEIVAPVEKPTQTPKFVSELKEPEKQEIIVPTAEIPRRPYAETMKPIVGAEPWLYGDLTELDGLTPELRNIVQMLEAENPYSGAILGEYRADLRDLVKNKNSTPEQVSPFLRRIARRMEEAERHVGRAIPRMPEDVMEQRVLIWELLERIEATDHPLSQTNLNIANEIKENLYRMDPELASECRARIRLHDSFAFIAAISGDTEQAIKDLRQASNELTSRGHILESEDFDRLLKKGIQGLRITEAFKKLEDWAINGKVVAGRPPGERVRYRQGDSSQVEQQTIRNSICEELGGNNASRKSLQLAERIAIATFETSVWNQKVGGKDVLAEAIYLKEYRKGRFSQSRDRGPDITIDKIEGFGSSFFRSARRVDKQPLVLKIAIPPAEIPDTEQRAFEETLMNSRIEEDRKTTLDFNVMNFDRLSQGALGTYLGNEVPRILGTKQLLLKTDFKPVDLTSEAVQGWVANFRVSDRDGSLKLRKYFIMGILDAGLAEAYNLGWGQVEIAEARKILTKKIGEDEDGKNLYFLTTEEIDDVLREIGAWGKARGNDFVLSLTQVLRTRR